jgi:hypothetical protein
MTQGRALNHAASLRFTPYIYGRKKNVIKEKSLVTGIFNQEKIVKLDLLY